MIKEKLAFKLVLCFCVLIIILTNIIGFSVGYIASNELEASQGQTLATLAFQVQDKFDRGMSERERDVRIASTQLHIDLSNSDFTSQRQLLNIMQATYEKYAWIGFADASGKVLVATKGLLEGQNVSKRPWHIMGLKDSFIGDVHEALLLEKLLKKDSSEPMRFVDVAIPIFDKVTSQILGVLGAHLNISWIKDVENSVISSLYQEKNIELFIVNGHGDVVISSKKGKYSSADLNVILSQLNMNQSPNHYAITTWPDGRKYLTGFSRSSKVIEDDNKHLDWIFLTRQNVDEAFLPALHLRNNIFMIGCGVLFFYFFIILYISRMISNPLAIVAKAADDTREGTKANIPIYTNYFEIKTISIALNCLIFQLKNLNQELENKITERTQKISLANEELHQEINKRNQAEIELKSLIIKLNDLAETDSLTQILNRRAFFEKGRFELKRALRLQTGLSIIMIDLDFFKTVNDKYGHAAGDTVLKEFAHVCVVSIRDTDLAARLGGEEFVVLLTEVNLINTKMIVERLMTNIREMVVKPSPDVQIKITASLGVAYMEQMPLELEGLLRLADKGLYQAKANGRNQIVYVSGS